MCQFIETIQLKDGMVYHLDWHQKRVDKTLKAHYTHPTNLCLEKIIYQESLPKNGLFKLRIVYNANEYVIETYTYQKRKIQSIEFVEIDFDYPYKALDRSEIDNVLKESTADEVVFCKNGFIYDSSYANVVLFDSKHWFTPSTFLLNGTSRQRLIHEKKIKVANIHKNDLHQFQKIGFINALNHLGEQTLILNNL